MEVFKITAAKYDHLLTASGRPNRWNKKGEFVIYAGSSRSLSTLELIVHRSAIQPMVPYSVVVLSISDDPDLYKTLSQNQLPENWKKISAYPQLQQIGSDWYKKQGGLVLKVPSAVIPFEFNYILNTAHSAFKENVRLVRTERYFWDERLPL
ncbi:RES family NAD+ phosphorylase [Flavimarina sp. Hel_I_48]|uniref:RES family NAD+ phosphorylase n=1 Tax=Flavimarina sp. Hel_I_48 TaxID=1392488 RepID=UPI0004DF90F6|nr:RES family NAD+ phosphorylase [Flavimarina sp. Hel_I_48]